MTTVEPVHHHHVDEEQNQKPDDGSLLRHPESEGSIANFRHRLIEEFSKQDAAPERNEGPDTKDQVNDVEALLPVAIFRAIGLLLGRIHGLNLVGGGDELSWTLSHKMATSANGLRASSICELHPGSRDRNFLPNHLAQAMSETLNWMWKTLFSLVVSTSFQYAH